MTIEQAIDNRHSVRAYSDEPIPKEIRSQLDAEVASINQESGLHIFIQYDDPNVLIPAWRITYAFAM